MSSQCYSWDFRINGDAIEPLLLKKILKQIAKHYIFQLEKGEETGYVHWQGRMSLIKKSFKPQLLKLWSSVSEGTPPPNFLEPTVNPPKNFDYFCYAGKADTRIGQTYVDEDDKEDIYIPRQFRDKMNCLRPFQRQILDSAKVFEDRIINLIYDDTGCHGKSVVSALSELLYNGIDLPPVNDAEQLVQSCCNICMDKGVRDPSPIFIDLPRAMNKDRLNGIYTAIEQIKKGKLYDMRYKYKAYWIDSPQIWVFSNIQPDMNYLSSDRWKIWMINDNYELEPYDQFRFFDEKNI